MAIYIRSCTKTIRFRCRQTGQMGRDGRTSFINDSHEHSAERTSRPRLLICESRLGRIDQSLCSSQPHSSESFSNVIAHKTLCRRWNRNIAHSHLQITKAKRNVRRIRSTHFRHPIRRSNFPIHANTLLGPCSRNPGRNPRSQSSHFASYHRMDPKTRSYLNWERPECSIPNGKLSTQM